MSWVEKKIPKCTKCGCEKFEKTGPAELKCTGCLTLYCFLGEKTIPKLIAKKGRIDSLPFSICSNKIIGRGDRESNDSKLGYVKIMGENNGSPEENTWVRNPCVSHKHAKIEVKEELMAENEGEKLVRLYTRRTCSIIDLGSSYGTAVNDRLLTSGEKTELHHNDKITLGVMREAIPTIFIFKEE